MYFTRLKKFSIAEKGGIAVGGRSGICEIFDYNCSVDSSYAKKCKGYKRVKYLRNNKIDMMELE